MYTKIAIPVDLAHKVQLEKALATAGLAKLYRIPVCFIGVTTAFPGAVAHSPVEYKAKLESFTRDEAVQRAVQATSIARVGHNPSVDLSQTLLSAIAECKADLVVMASYVRGAAEHVFASNAGYLAVHAPVSVLVVR